MNNEKLLKDGEKAYKILALQLGISTGKAKDLIDMGLVYSHGKRLTIARAMMPKNTEFKVEQVDKIEKIFEDANLLVVNKPAFVDSETIEKKFGIQLLHRLDRETSGVLMLVKNEEFREKAIAAFRRHEVYKEYLAIVDGLIAEGGVIDVPLRIVKDGKAKAVVDKKGDTAITEYEPVAIMGNKTKLKVVIKTGRTHQIRAHLKHIKFPIIGDTNYGGQASKRVMLHAHKVKMFNYEFTAKEPKEFVNFEQLV
jgi:23S rRNA pseudouridine1911/1915/1917 synthase